MSLVNFSNPFANCFSSPCKPYNFPAGEFNTIHGRGAIPFFSWANDALPVSGDQSDYQLSDVIAGRHDSYITAWATAAKAWGHPFFLRFNWEMNGRWFPWSEGVNGNQTGEYVAAWRHVHDIFTRVGATNTTWVWCPNIDPGHAIQSLGELYPGDGYVDWTCLDGYNFNAPRTSFKDCRPGRRRVRRAGAPRARAPATRCTTPPSSASPARRARPAPRISSPPRSRPSSRCTPARARTTTRRACRSRCSRAPDGTEALVLEMGARAPGDIAALCAIARPTVGVITNIGLAHAGPLGGRDGVARAKGELLEALDAHGLGGARRRRRRERRARRPHRRRGCCMVSAGAARRRRPGARRRRSTPSCAPRSARVAVGQRRGRSSRCAARTRS